MPSIQKLLTELGDFVFPPSHGEKLLRTIEPTAHNKLYQPGRYKNIMYLSKYSEPVVQAAITANKFHRHQKAAKFLGSLLALWLASQKDSTVFIPIPLGKQRLRQRGHNQVETLLDTVQVKVDTSILQRSVETLPQSQLKKSERMKNMQQVFQYNGKAEDLMNYNHVILLDDVVTTGATLKAARATLAPHFPPHTKLTCLAIAH